MSVFKHLFTFLIIHALIITIITSPDDSRPVNKTSGIYNKAAVASDNGACSDIGRSILKKGGTAVETAIATAVCIGVMDPHSSGLGGGHFLTVYNKKPKTCTIVDARETAPFKVDVKAYESKTELAQIGWLSVAVPGELHGFWTAYKLFGGQVPWKDLWTPTIELCRKGIKVSLALSRILKQEADWMKTSPYFRDFINSKTGQPKVEGDEIKLPKLADTMEQIANSNDPVSLFYNSKMTDLMVAEFSKNGGSITKDDFKNYTAKFGESQRPPVYTKLKGNLTFCAPPPPSSGGVTTSIINVLDAFYNTSIDNKNTTAQIQFFHRFLESSKFAYGIRSKLGDMDFVDSAYQSVLSANFLSYGQFTSQKMGDIKSMRRPNYYGASTTSWGPPPDYGTAEISVVDQYGNAASMTSSINTYFGSRIRSEVTGIIYNNQMDDFSIRTASNFYGIAPSEENRMEPGKRPQSSMSPLIGFDGQTGQVRMVIGAEGGVKIIAAVSQVIARVLYLNESIDHAIRAPRIYNQLLPYPSTYETGFPKEILDKLNSTYGETVQADNSSFFSVVTGINRLSDGRLEASTDFRKAGGYSAGI